MSIYHYQSLPSNGGDHEQSYFIMYVHMHKPTIDVKLFNKKYELQSKRCH